MKEVKKFMGQGEMPIPFIQDVTLRDGNQALRKPWSIPQKNEIFQLLLKLGVQGAEIGYPGASSMDFDAFVEVASSAPKGMMVSALARTNDRDIDEALGAIFRSQMVATPCLHTFIAMSEYNMRVQLGKTPDQVRKMAVQAVKKARQALGDEGHVQFSPEHFGDCLNNLGWVIDCLVEIVDAGADIINLPTTVERYRPDVYAKQVAMVRKALPGHVVVSAHCHNDLGMGTATTVAGYFAGARQLEVTLNGLGERAGNTNLYEVATALHCNGVDVSLNFQAIQEVATKVAQMSGVPIPEKAALVGSDCFTQRSGIHQHGAAQTFGRSRKNYCAIDPAMIGRAGGETLEFTSQSGYTAVMTLLRDAGYPVEADDARLLQPALKLVSETRGALTIEQLVEGFNALLDLRIKKPKGDITQAEINAVVRDAIGTLGERTWRFIKILLSGDMEDHSATVVLEKDGQKLPSCAEVGNGPVDAAYNAIKKITGIEAKVIDYNIGEIDGGSDAPGQADVTLEYQGVSCKGEGVDTSVINASVKAYLEALNQILEVLAKKEAFATTTS